MERLTLYRPVGPEELALAEASGGRAFLPRLANRPSKLPTHAVLSNVSHLKLEFAKGECCQVGRSKMWEIPPFAWSFDCGFWLPVLNSRLAPSHGPVCQGVESRIQTETQRT